MHSGDNLSSGLIAYAKNPKNKQQQQKNKRSKYICLVLKKMPDWEPKGSRLTVRWFDSLIPFETGNRFFWPAPFGILWTLEPLSGTAVIDVNGSGKMPSIACEIWTLLQIHRLMFTSLSMALCFLSELMTRPPMSIREFHPGTNVSGSKPTCTRCLDPILRGWERDSRIVLGSLYVKCFN